MLGFLTLLALPEMLHGQDNDWHRSIDAGDPAVAKKQYAEAEAAYREALALAEKRWKANAAAPVLDSTFSLSILGLKMSVIPISQLIAGSVMRVVGQLPER